MEGIGENGYNYDKASEIAQRAVNDATHMMTFEMQDNHNSYFEKKLKMICTFLKRAIKIERANEKVYVQTLIKDLKQAFPDSPDLKPLIKIQKLLESKDKFDYDLFIIQINILKSGLSNTKEIFNYENKRLQKLDPIINGIFDSREHQTQALLEKRDASLEKIIERGERSRAKLKHKYIVEYTGKQTLTRRTDNGHGRYALWGAGKIEREVPEALDRVLAQWAQNTVSSIINKKEFLNQIIAKMKVKYPYNGNFNLLEQDVQERIILSIVSYGMSNLKTVLNETLSSELSEKIVNDIVDTDSHFLDMSQELRIDGLEKNNFGLRLSETELFKEAKTISDLEKGHAIKLYEALERTIKLAEQNDNDTLLNSVLKNSVTSHNGKSSTAKKDLDEIIKLINYVGKLKKELDSYNEQFQSILKSGKKQIPEEKTSKIDARIKFVVNGNKVEIDQNSLSKLKEDLGNTEGYIALGFKAKTLNANSLASLFTTLKRQSSLAAKSILSQAVKDFLNKKIIKKMSASKLISILKKELTKTTIQINGPTLAELIPGLQLAKRGSSYYFDWNNYKGKNDSVEIIINHNAIATAVLNGIRSHEIEPKQLTTDLQQALRGPLAEARRDYLSTIQKHLNKTVENVTTENHENKYSEVADEFLNIIKSREKQYRDVQNAKRRWQYHVKKWAAQYAQGNKQLQDEVQKTLLDSIKDSIYVSNTTKSANDYWNEFGVKGGTLGNTSQGINLNLQLARIQNIFTSAGMPIPDNEMQWLNSAIINCFPNSVAKETNKHLIEQYLGSLIAFALFDEGGAEGQIVDHLYKKLQDEQPFFGGRIMHLYLVNSIYYPGSFILQRTLNEIEGILAHNLQQVDTITRKGAGIIIINPAKESIIGNRPIFEQTNPDPNIWQNTGLAVKEKIDIRILFLAGLMDIIKSINEKLGNAVSTT